MCVGPTGLHCVWIKEHTGWPVTNSVSFWRHPNPAFGWTQDGAFVHFYSSLWNSCSCKWRCKNCRSRCTEWCRQDRKLWTAVFKAGHSPLIFHPPKSPGESLSQFPNIALRREWGRHLTKVMDTDFFDSFLRYQHSKPALLHFPFFLSPPSACVLNLKLAVLQTFN